MNDPFAYKTRSGLTIGDILFKPLDEAGAGLTAVDVGARNGMFLLPASYAGKVNLIGFEPNACEYDKLVRRETDAIKHGMIMPKFKSEKYHDFALWHQNGSYPLYLTVGPGAITLMGKTDPKITSQMHLEGDEESYEKKHSSVKSTISVRCRRLDEVVDASTKVDFLKLDVEGGELNVLEGASKLLAAHNILFIKTESQFLPYYDKHPLFGDQHVFMNKNNFRLLGIDLNHPKYTRGISKMPNWADRGLIYAGDAYYMKDPDRAELTPLDLHRMALMCMVFDFNSLAISLLSDARLIKDDEIREIEQALIKRLLKRRLIQVWEQMPKWAIKNLRKFKK